MARTSWFDDKAEHPMIQEQVEKLESFTSALADGVVSKQELNGQEQRLMAAMKALEAELSDDAAREGHDAARRADRLQRDAAAARAAGRAHAYRAMKRAERQRLKQNDLGALTRQVQDLFTERKRELGWLAVAVVVVGAAAIGYWAWHEREQRRAHALLAEAMIVQETRVGPPPAPGTAGQTFPTERERAQAAVVKFKAAADAYPSTDAGIFARYQEASTQMALGNPKEAVNGVSAGDRSRRRAASTARWRVSAWRKRRRAAGSSIRRSPRYKELAQRKDGGLPIDGILMQLGRAYRDAGRASDAQQTFNRLIEEFPDSPFSADAKRELDSLKKT